jgi:DNA-binding LacI/PurR family transcriptional regulator
MKMSEKTVKTIQDVARLAGVSKSTVSRALNDSPLISAETKNRIQAIARQYDFQLNIPAQCLSLKESRTIAFVTHACYIQDGYLVGSPFLLEVLGGITAALSESRYDLLMAFIDPKDTHWLQHYQDSGRADGFILMTSSRKQSLVRKLAKTNAPFIVWGNPLPDYNHCSVTGDDFTGGKLATQHLIKSGKRRIAFLGGMPDEPEVQRRYEGYCFTLHDAGLEIDPALVTYGDYSFESGADAMQHLLEQAPDLDAVFVNSDLMAISAMNLLHDRGYQIPGDVAVVGYDDLTIAEQCYPQLTTISQNIPLAGRLLAQNLIQYLRSNTVTNVSIPPKLVVRKSA